MPDIDRALADITEIRSQLAAGTLFRGFGPAVIALTGVLALLVASAQTIWPGTFAADSYDFLVCWSIAAVLAAVLVCTEMVARSRRHHGGLADAVVIGAIERFLPAGFAGVAIAVVFLKYSPDVLWTLPGIWQVLVALGIFASARSLPRQIKWVGAWYFLAGICVLVLESASHSLSPWTMGVPFAVGQFAMAAVLHFAFGEFHAQER